MVVGVNVKRRLALFYLANDVIQNCKRKNATILQDKYREYLVAAIPYVRDSSIKSSIERVVRVWSERNVYDKDFIDRLLKELSTRHRVSIQVFTKHYQKKFITVVGIFVFVLEKSNDEPSLVDTMIDETIERKSPPPPANSTVDNSTSDDAAAAAATTGDLDEVAKIQQIIAEFQTKRLCEAMSSFQSLQGELGAYKSSMEATRLLDVSSEHIKQYRDKSQCAKFKVEFDNSCVKLEEYVAKLTAQAEQRHTLVKLIEKGEIFYDAQFKDVKTVYNVSVTVFIIIIIIICIFLFAMVFV